MEPTDATLEPTEATMEPTEATMEPTDATLEPTLATMEPTEATLEPTEATMEPTLSEMESLCLTDCWMCHDKRDPCLWEMDTTQNQDFDTFDCDTACQGRSTDDETEGAKGLDISLILTLVGAFVLICLTAIGMAICSDDVQCVPRVGSQAASNGKGERDIEAGIRGQRKTSTPQLYSEGDRINGNAARNFGAWS